jgi:glutaredoxin
MVESIVSKHGHTDTVEYLTGDKGTSKIIELGIMASPVLLVDDKIVMVGFLSDINKIETKIYGHL